MAVTLFCPNLKCRSILQVPEDTRGKKVRCGKCGTTFAVPFKKETNATAPVGEAAPPNGRQDAPPG